jgi:hypothetical protein
VARAQPSSRTIGTVDRRRHDDHQAEVGPSADSSSVVSDLLVNALSHLPVINTGGPVRHDAAP